MPTKVRIFAFPSGDDIPVDIRTKMIGLELDADGPVTIPIAPWTGVGGNCDSQRAYLVPTSLFLQAMKEHNKEAWEWLVVRAHHFITCVETDVCIRFDRRGIVAR